MSDFQYIGGQKMNRKKNKLGRSLDIMENEKRLRQTSCRSKEKMIFKKSNLYNQRIGWWFPEARGVEEMGEM